MKDDHLQHHGVKGQKWGVRRYQNKDGSLTSAGKKRAAKKQQKMDSKDRDWYYKNVNGWDLSSAKVRKKAGKQIDARHEAWSDYFKASNGGKVNNKQTRALLRKYDKASVDMLNALLSDVRTPSGRTPKWSVDDDRNMTLSFMDTQTNNINRKSINKGRVFVEQQLEQMRIAQRVSAQAHDMAFNAHMQSIQFY